jgi:hypothetical protein
MTERHRAMRPMDSSSGNGRRSGLLLAFPSSNQNVRADLHALQGAGMLTLFCTTIAWRHGRGLFGILPRPIRQELARRTFDGIDPARISTFPTREVIRLIASRLGISVSEVRGCSPVNLAISSSLVPNMLPNRPPL